MSTQPITYLIENVADSTAFRTWVGAANNAAAKLHIFDTAETDPPMPFAIITTEDMKAQRIGTGGSDSYSWEGSLALWFDAVAGYTDDRDSIAAFTTVVQAIIEQVLALSGQAGYLSIARVGTEGAGFAEIDRKNASGKKTVRIKYTIEWK